jgi:hypothetical protein
MVVEEGLEDQGGGHLVDNASVRLSFAARLIE